SLRRYDHLAVSPGLIRRRRVVLCHYSSAHARTSPTVGALLYLAAARRLSDGYCRVSGLDGLQGRVAWCPNVLESCGPGDLPCLVTGAGICLTVDPVHPRRR